MARKTALYEALAAHLNPNDPAEGAEQIDVAILATQRARCRPWNLARGLFFAGNILFALGVVSLVFRGCAWFDPSFAHTPMASLAKATPVWGASLLVAIAIGVLVMSTWVEEMGGALRPYPPAPIHAWLKAHGKSDLIYWHEIYWSQAKIQAHRREIMGFTFWRKKLRPVDQYPAVAAGPQRFIAPPDPHWIYLDSEEGRADSIAYLVEFEHRIDAWRRLCFKGILAILAVIGFLIWLPEYPETLAGRLLRVGAMLAFMMLCMRIAFRVGTIPMRWLPARVRRYWFRDLPPEAARFRDHMIALYGY